MIMSNSNSILGRDFSENYTTARVRGNNYRVTSIAPVSEGVSAQGSTASSATAVLVDTYVKEGRTYPAGAHTEMWVCNNGTYGKRYTLVKVQSLPVLTPDCFITKAYLYFRPSAAPGKICFYAREMLADWDPATAVYSTVADHIGDVNIDCCECSCQREYGSAVLDHPCQD